MGSSWWTRAGGWLGGVLFYAAATACFTWPLPLVASSQLFCRRYLWLTSLYQGDLFLIIWIQRWIMHALATDPLHLLDANAFHPVPNVLVRSEFLLGNLPMFAPLYWLTGNPVLALNGCILASFVLCGICMHLVVRRWTGSTTVALVAGLAFAFAPWRIPDGLGRPHLLQAQYLPLALLGLERTAATGRPRIALATAFVIALQAICSSYHAYLVFLLAGAYLVADVLGRGVRGRRRALGALALAILLPFAVALVVTLPHVLARMHGGLPVPRVPGRGSLPDVVGEWVGFGTAALALGALPLLVLARRDRARTVRLVALLLMTGAAWVVGQGSEPIGGVLDAYAFLKSFVPGMTHIRAPQRFGILASFGASALGALALAAALTALRRARRGRWLRPVTIAAAVTAVLLPITLNLPPESLAVPVGDHIPPAYRWLAEHGNGGPLLEVPVRTGFTDVRTAATVQYFSTYHWLPILNGHTGYAPPQYPLIANLATQLPSASALQLLVDCTGLRWVLDHNATPERTLAWDNLPVRAHIFGRDPPGQDRLFEIRMPPRGPCAENFLRPDVTLEGNPLTLPSKLEGRLRVDGFVPEGKSYHESQLLLTIENRGTERWPCTSVDPQRRVSFGISLSNEAGKGFQELVIPRDLGPGEVIQLPFWASYPGRPGAYLYRFVPTVGGRQLPNPDPQLTWESRIVVVAP